MITKFDKDLGMIKVYWEDVHKHIAKIEPTFAGIVNKLAPDKSFPYSLQNPSTRVFSPKSREVSSTLFEIRELEHIMKIFAQELSKENEACSDTIIGKIAKRVKFNYFHNKVDRHRIVRPSMDIVTIDKRFETIHPDYKKSEAVFASDAPFVRGCISISHRD